eukprot:5818778-Pyramimonas_sp.AAC.1
MEHATRGLMRNARGRDRLVRHAMHIATCTGCKVGPSVGPCLQGVTFLMATNVENLQGVSKASVIIYVTPDGFPEVRVQPTGAT